MSAVSQNLNFECRSPITETACEIESQRNTSCNAIWEKQRERRFSTLGWKIISDAETGCARQVIQWFLYTMYMFSSRSFHETPCFYTPGSKTVLQTNTKYFSGLKGQSKVLILTYCLIHHYHMEFLDYSIRIKFFKAKIREWWSSVIGCPIYQN